MALESRKILSAADIPGQAADRSAAHLGPHAGDFTACVGLMLRNPWLIRLVRTTIEKTLITHADKAVPLSAPVPWKQ